MSLPLESNFTPAQVRQLEHLLAPIRNHLNTLPSESRQWVACSGGLDSVLLLWALATLAPERTTAIHINHGIHPEAGSWAQWLSELCASWVVPCQIVSIHVATDTGNLEARARAARYEVFADHVNAQDVIWLGHHANDQVETFFLQLMRGAGVKGLAGMPKQRKVGQGHLYRPWLEVPRATLAHMAEALDLTWIEDPANTDLAFDRNFIRHRVLPLLEQRWPHAHNSVFVSQQHLVEAQYPLNNYYTDCLSTMIADDGSLMLDAWLSSGAETHQLSLLRHWLTAARAVSPTAQQLVQIRHQVALARRDAQGSVALEGGTVRRFQNRLYWVTNKPEMPQECAMMGGLEQGFVATDPSFGRILLEPCVGQGIALSKITTRPVIRRRQGGEIMQPSGRRHHRDSKRLLQELSVPPWQRDWTPLIFVGDVWVALADLCIDVHWLAQPQERALRVIWEPGLCE